LEANDRKKKTAVISSIWKKNYNLTQFIDVYISVKWDNDDCKSIYIIIYIYI
jgi:hypothetical protein